MSVLAIQTSDSKDRLMPVFLFRHGVISGRKVSPVIVFIIAWNFSNFSY